MHLTQAFDFKHTLPKDLKLEFLNIVSALFTKLERTWDDWSAVA